MADVAEEGVVIAACSSLLVAASFGAATVLNKRKKRKNSTWVKQYIGERESLGALLSELATDEVTRCVQYLRMDIVTLEELFLQVENTEVRQQFWSRPTLYLPRTNLTHCSIYLVHFVLH